MQPPPYGSAPASGGLRPLDLGEVLDQGIQVYRRNFRALATTAAVVVVPAAVIEMLVQLSARPSAHSSQSVTIGGFQFSNGSGDVHDATVRLVASVVVLFITLVSYWLTVGACTRAISDSYVDGSTAQAGPSLRAFARAFPSLLWLAAIVAPSIMIAFALCFVPAIFLWVSWCVAVPALIVEGTRGTHALSRSFELVRGRRWPIFGVTVLAVLLAEVVRFSLVLALVGVLLRSHSTASTAYIVTAGIVGAIGSLLTTPWVAAVYVILYYDLRVRREGLDVQMQLAGLDRPAAGREAPPAARWSPPPTAPPSWGAPPPPPPAPPAAPPGPPR